MKKGDPITTVDGVHRRVAGALHGQLLVEPPARGLWYLLSDENRTWIRGHHARDSEAVAAMRSAFALTTQFHHPPL